MQIFVPVEDAPSGALAALLVPYQCGLVCEHALREGQVLEMWARFAANDVGLSEPSDRVARDPDSSSPPAVAL